MKRSACLWFIYLILFGLFGCKPAAPLLSDGASPIKVQGNKNYTLDIAHKKISSEQDEVIEFLVDDSGSVDDNCGSNMIDVQYKFVDFLVGIFRDTIISSDAKKLYIGVGRFADSYSTIVPPISVDSLNAVQFLPHVAGSDTRFSVGVNGAVQEIYSLHPTAYKKRLIILTDGDFSSDNSLDVENELERQINEHPDLKIYVGICQSLLSSDYYKTWETQISIPEYIEVFSGMNELAKALYDDARYFLPNSFIVFPETLLKDYSVSGYFTSVNFWFWNPLGTSNRVEDTTATNNNITIEANSPYPYTLRIAPLRDCLPHTLSAKAPPGSFIFYNQKSFDNAYMILSSEHPGGDVKIINSHDVKLAFEFKLADLSVDLANWKDCFTVDLVKEDGSLIDSSVNLTTGSCGDSVCLTGDGLRFEIVWTPLTYRYAEELKIKVRFYSIDNTDLVWESGLIKVPVKFKAEYINVDSNNGEEENELHVHKIYVDFQSVLPTENPPSVFLMTSLDEDALGQYSGVKHQWDLCPRGEGMYYIDGQQLLKSELNLSCLSLNAIPRGNMCPSQPNSEYPYEIKYSFSVYEYVISECKFDSLMFVWPETNVSSESVWICRNLLSSSIKCRDETFK